MNFNQWKNCKLGDFIEILSGYAFKSKDFKDEGIPVIKIKNIVPPNIDFSDVQYVSEELYREKNRYSLEYNDILISLTGSNVNQINSAVGKVGRVRTKDIKLLMNQRVGKVYVKDESKNSNDFLYYFLTQNHIRYDLASIAGGSANQANINPQNIKDLNIHLPPIEEQKAIANILSMLDHKIEVNNKINQKLEEISHTIFKQWFIDFDFPNDKGRPYKSSGGIMVESESGMIPQGWQYGNVFDNIKLIKEKNKNNEQIPVLTVVKEGRFTCSEDYFTKQVYSKNTSNYKIVCRYDIAYNPSRANIGSIAMLKEFDRGLVSPMYVVFRLDENIYPFYFDYYMKLPGFIDKIALNSSGTTRQNFDFKAFKDFEIVIPPLDIQEKGYKIVKNIEDLIKKNIVKNEKLATLRDILLPKLMSGELRI